LKDEMDLIPTASQTVGPFFHLGLTNAGSIARIAGPNARGERIRLICKVIDGEGIPLPDAMVEIWQANADGKYHHPEDKQEKPLDPDFGGFGRLSSDPNGICEFETIKPGRAPGMGGALQAPHLNISVFARGILKRLATRAYFAGDPANPGDAVLALVPEDRRDTLMALSDSGKPGLWRFDIHLCGPQETVFFDV
jgi:protocatechuate 3,4-dioxygenase alpha subunit